jgi:hypothetical protein
MASHRRIGSIWQPEFVQPDATLAGGRPIGRHHWKESLEQHLVRIVARQRDGEGAADQA